MPDEVLVRNGVGRRQQDTDCAEHDRRLDDVEINHQKLESRWTSMLWFIGIAVIGLGGFNSVILSKVTAIESLLTDSKVVQMQHSEQIKALQQDVKDIQERHKYLDQNGIVIRKPGR